MIDEKLADAPARPSFGRVSRGLARGDPIREVERVGVDLLVSEVTLDRRHDMHARAASELGPAVVALALEQVADGERRVAHEWPLDAGPRIEVEDQMIGPLDVVDRRRPGM